MSGQSFVEELKQLEEPEIPSALTNGEGAAAKARPVKSSGILGLLIKLTTYLPDLVRLMHVIPWDPWAYITSWFTTSEFDDDN